jgi:hypothetical protein
MRTEGGAGMLSLRCAAILTVVEKDSPHWRQLSLIRYGLCRGIYSTRCTPGRFPLKSGSEVRHMGAGGSSETHLAMAVVRSPLRRRNHDALRRRTAQLVPAIKVRHKHWFQNHLSEIWSLFIGWVVWHKTRLSAGSSPRYYT